MQKRALKLHRIFCKAVFGCLLHSSKCRALCITTNEVEGRSLTLSWTLSSQSVEKNTSTISWTLKGSGSASGYVMSGAFKAVINGVTVYTSEPRIELRNTTTVASGTATIAHKIGRAHV